MRRSGSRSALAAVPAVIAVVLALAACGDDSAEEGRGQVSADDLDGLEFVATSIDGHEIVEGSEVVVAFADGAVSIRAGCNTQSGGYDVVDGVLQVDALMATMMACEEALMAQDQIVADIVAGGPTIDLDGDDLVLTAGDGAMALTARA